MISVTSRWVGVVVDFNCGILSKSLFMGDFVFFVKSGDWLSFS